MHIVAVVVGVVVIMTTLSDAFETIVLPRRVTRRFRLARQFFHYSWQSWAAIARHLTTRVDREGTSTRDRFLSVYGPVALLVLLGLWAIALILSFALIMWGLHPQMNVPPGSMTFSTLVYLSGVTFFTLGYGDIVPLTVVGRGLAVVEVATGFSFLALIIGYLPVIYAAFSRREANITLLDARAGSPPSAGELLRRHAQFNDTRALDQLLREWESWSSELLESHLSYPVLSFFRSQHDHLSWLASLTVILDTCTLVIVGLQSAEGPISPRQARLTFAMARHVLSDLSQILYATPHGPHIDRLPSEDRVRLREMLAQAGLEAASSLEADGWLLRLRAMYEPYMVGLAEHLLFPIPSWLPSTSADDWQTTAWDWEPAQFPPASVNERA